MAFKDKFKSFQNLTVNDSIILRQVDIEADLESNLSTYRNPEVWKYYGGCTSTNTKMPEDTVKKILSNQIRFFEKGTMYVWTIADKDTNTAMGRIHLSNFEANNKIANIGYFLDEKYWNKGIISDCIPSVVDFGFSYLELERIYSTIHVGNTASWKALEKNGFAREGLLRHCFVCPSGLSDCYMYARIKVESC